MPPSALAFLNKFGIYVGIALVVAGVLTLTYCKGREAGGFREIIGQQEREIEGRASAAAAASKAADDRVKDEVELAKQEEELRDERNDALSPDDARRRRGCVILRQQGRDTSGLPCGR